MHLPSTLSLLVTLPLSASAQTTNDITHALMESYHHGLPTTLSRRISPRKVERTRDCVWKAWQKGLLQEPLAEGLPRLDGVDSVATSSWKIIEEGAKNGEMPFYLLRKGEAPNGGYPFFLYLHGSGPKEQEWATGLALAQRFKDRPSKYFIPQIPNEGPWYRWYQRSKQMLWERLFVRMMADSTVNPNRLYIFGISEGGYGSQRLASFYADYLAAAGPMAGGEPLKNAPVENLGNIGFSLRTGAEDKGFYRDILTRYTKEALDSIEALYPGAYRHQVELIPGRGHHIDYAPTTPWLSGFTRNPWPKTFIWERFEMDGRYRRGFYNLEVVDEANQSPQGRTRYEFSVSDNTVRLKVAEVDYRTTQRDSIWGIEMKFDRSYRLATQGHVKIYLNEELVDLKRPVTVFVNDRKVFKGRLNLNLSHMVESLSLFGDPKRIFPACVEVNIGNI